MKKKQLLTGGGITILLLILLGVWNLWFGVTKVAFVNYQVITLGQIAKANDNSFIRIDAVPEDELDRLGKYDMIFLNGMGLRIVEEQRAQLQKIADKGIPIHTLMATNPANHICNLDSIQQKEIREYLAGGGRRNYRSLLNYVRKNIDRKLIAVAEPEEPVRRASDILYHAEVGGEDELDFISVEEYETFLKENGIWKENGKKVAITGQMADPAGLIAALEENGINVYPISSFRKLQDFLNRIDPDAVINLPHGRMGDKTVEYLTERNIPLFAPLTINSLVEDWENDPMGMSGGFLSQSVVTPEIDGAIRSFALFAQYRDEDGLHHSFAIPERLETFVRTVRAYLELKDKPNPEKRVAIYYFKGPGQNAMTAGGMEVAPSLYNLLTRMKAEGYKVDNLPADHKELEKMIMAQGAVFGAYAEGAFDGFMKTGNPELISKETYESWVKHSLRPEKYAEVVAANGEFPGAYMTTEDGRLGVARLQFGNVALLPQNAAGSGNNSFEVVHGTNAAPPHTYIASYLWMQHGFKADALIHFGTHGSLEFTPKKQVALSSLDWPDRLVGAVPHFYVYSIGNVGEGIIAKRRSYAGLQSYLTPPFLESSVRGIYRELTEKIRIYNQAPNDKASLAVKAVAVKMGIHRELGLDSVPTIPYTGDQILKVENFAEELATEKITGQLYTMGVPYESARITSSVYAMATEPVAYSLLALDKLRGKADGEVIRNRGLFTQRYLNPSRALVERLTGNPGLATDELVCKTANISMEELRKARAIDAARNAPTGMMAMMMAGTAGSHGQAKKEYGKDEIAYALAILEVEQTIRNIGNYKTALLQSPEIELSSAMNVMNGGYTVPSPGGDPIANPNTIPTGRNLYSINAEATPSESAWEKGVKLAQHTIDMYRERHDGEYPRKVSYTLWSGEFIETGGATIAQVLYMLGVEPVRDTFGRVSDLKLIPSAELGRPRIDVVVQTSGQLRDIAASRLFLIDRAVEMAAAAKDNEHGNMVAAGVVEAERTLTEKGLSPKDAREISTFRVFGGVNGGYGTGIQGMVEAGDRWENESEIANVYLNNMGAYYGSEKKWEAFRKFAFEAALTRTDVVIQPRQSNTWGALSLDHVYEFMGGLNLAVRNVTGKDPDAYLSDYRNRNNVRMQELKEAIGVESRTTIFNPAYIREKMKGEASSAGVFAETIRNTYGWNVMKPAVIDKELWDEIYEVYVKDKHNLGVQAFFETRNPAALEEITAVMLETVRKGMWKAGEQQITDISKLHTDLVNKYRPSCSGFVCDNAKLRDFIASKSDPQAAGEYKENIAQVRQASANNDKGVVMKKDELNPGNPEQTNTLNDIIAGIIIFAVLVGIILFVRYGRKRQT
ncbi:MAG: cobaltochelatase subunit CobN [Mediterranea sp.]|jgi:cobaltochelatase CobN|nr:cobaltochelatase subunit CobN [Mediterranea sp.]